MITLPDVRIDGNRLRCFKCNSPNLYGDYITDIPVLACMMCSTRHNFRERPKRMEVAIMPVKKGTCSNCGRTELSLVKDLCTGLCYVTQLGKTGDDRDKALAACREKVQRMNTGEKVRGLRKAVAPALPSPPAEKQDPQSAKPFVPKPLGLPIVLTFEDEIPLFKKLCDDAKADRRGDLVQHVYHLIEQGIEVRG